MRQYSHNQLKTRPILFGCYLTVLMIGLAGCASSGGSALPQQTVSRPADAPYGVVDVSYQTDLVHTYTRCELYHWDKEGKKTLVWRYLSNQLLQTNDMALFHGYITTGASWP